MTDIMAKFKRVLGAEINDALDRATDPAKVSARELRKLKTNLENMRTETASMMADIDILQDDIKKNEKEISTLNDYIQKAATAGNDEDVQELIMQRLIIEDATDELRKTLAEAKKNMNLQKQEYLRLSTQITSAETRQRSIAGKVALAETRNSLTTSGASVSNISGRLGIFREMETKADTMLRQSGNMERLEALENDPSIEIKQKYQLSMDERIRREMHRIEAAVQ